MNGEEKDKRSKEIPSLMQAPKHIYDDRTTYHSNDCDLTKEPQVLKHPVASKKESLRLFDHTFLLESLNKKSKREEVEERHEDKLFPEVSSEESEEEPPKKEEGGLFGYSHLLPKPSRVQGEKLDKRQVVVEEEEESEVKPLARADGGEFAECYPGVYQEANPELGDDDEDPPNSQLSKRQRIAKTNRKLDRQEKELSK